jgi:NAD(P)-dependent dehydrogenase (short-subunit alcohol dehydrogenase family)
VNIDLSGKKAVVTGASAGIGLAVVRALTQAGAAVSGAARTISPELEQLATHTFAVDLTTTTGPAAYISEALGQLGQIDILVNNVGGGVTLAPGFQEISDEVWQEAFNLNVMTLVRATRAALPSLVQQHGAIVNIGSMNSHLADPRLAHYSAAKAAVTNITKALAAEYTPQGVRVNSISPGPVRTRLWTNPDIAKRAGVTPAEFVAQVPAMAGLATGQIIEPEEVAALTVLLVSGQVPSITGSDHVIDAGMTPPSRYVRPN